MACASGLELEEDRPKMLGTGERGTWAEAFCEKRWEEPNPSIPQAANTRTKPAPATRTPFQLRLDPFPVNAPRPFPITLFLRCTPIIIGESRTEARVFTRRRRNRPLL